MPIAPTLHKYLAAQNIPYDEIPHVLTTSSARTAQACHVSGDRLAKAILLRRDGGYMLAVLPASHHLRLMDLKARFGGDIDMATESEVNSLFADCARGAVPAAGACQSNRLRSPPIDRACPDDRSPKLAPRLRPKHPDCPCL
jgi:Ala-tRNA(Pro) deacylase